MEAQTSAKIIELIDKFDSDQGIYRSSQYNETWLRTESINAFFEALGWDVYHRQECRADKWKSKKKTLSKSRQDQKPRLQLPVIR